jgi:drug/metabolite transporter (DMT)-like permease
MTAYRALATTAASPGAAVLIMLTAMLVFTVNDTVGKWLTSSYSISQLVLFRGVIGLVILAPLLRGVGVRALFAVERPWTMVLRAILTMVDTFAFYYAVSYLPLADVMTYFLAAPIYVAALAPLVLGEQVGWRRWSAIAVGFAGVLVALEPSGQMFTLPALASIIGSMAYGFMLLSARTLKATPGITLIFWQTAVSAIVGLALAPVYWSTPQVGDLPALCTLGVLGMLAHVLVNWAFKLADASVVAPLQYTQLFWAIVFGWLVFGDFPSPPKFIGAGLIIAAGLYIFFRERSLNKLVREASVNG